MTRTAEHNQKIANALKGKKHTTAHVAASSAARVGYIWGRECRSCMRPFQTTGARSWVCDDCRSVSTSAYCSKVLFEELMRVQEGACGLCGDRDPPIVCGRKLHVDHCHETGLVRGLLCTYCNRVAVPVLERFAPTHHYLTNPPSTKATLESRGTGSHARMPGRVPAPPRKTTQPGVAWHCDMGKWRAYGKEGARQVYLGLFADEHEAAKVAFEWRVNKERK